MLRKFVSLTALGLLLIVTGSAGAQLGKGKVLFEYWDNIGGTAVSDLTSNALYPDKPTSSEWRDKYQSPSGRADNYGVRARAFLTPPADGDYTLGDLWTCSETLPYATARGVSVTCAGLPTGGAALCR